MEEQLQLCTFLNTSSTFPEAYTQKQDLLSGIIEILSGHTQIEWCVTTLGKRGCVLVKRKQDTNSNSSKNYSTLEQLEEESVRLSKDNNFPIPVEGMINNHIVIFCSSSKVDKVIDTTGCGDAFVGGMIYSIVKKWNLVKSISFATTVAGIKTTKVGARNALPSSKNSKLEEIKKYSF